MTLHEKLYTAEDLWVLSGLPRFEGHQLELHGGVLVMHPVGREHGTTTLLLGSRVLAFVHMNHLGEVMTEVGHYVEQHTVYSPDIAFTSTARLPEKSAKGYMNLMPDLAVEVKSPGNTFEELTEKARYYLKHGSKMVWIVYPATQTVEVVTASDDPENPQVETVGRDSVLRGGDVLPGFTLPINEIFP